MADVSILSEADLQIVLDHVDGPLAQRMLLSEYTLHKHRDSKLSIIVPADQIHAQTRYSYNLIKAKARLDADHGSSVELDCFVAYGYWERLRPVQGRSVDILAHLSQLFPKLRDDRHTIGLFTCQNGIQNTLEDFEDMCTSVTAKLHPEKPLFIGLYNSTSGKLHGIAQDLHRLLREPMLNMNSFLFARQMFMTLGQILSEVSPQLLWAHIAHSEGGLITRDCLMDQSWGLSDQDRRLLQKHLITMIYGGVAAIPRGKAFQTLNTYSNRDIALRL